MLAGVMTIEKKERGETSENQREIARGTRQYWSGVCLLGTCWEEEKGMATREGQQIPKEKGRCPNPNLKTGRFNVPIKEDFRKKTVKLKASERKGGRVDKLDTPTSGGSSHREQRRKGIAERPPSNRGRGHVTFQPITAPTISHEKRNGAQSGRQTSTESDPPGMLTYLDSKRRKVRKSVSLFLGGVVAERKPRDRGLDFVRLAGESCARDANNNPAGASPVLGKSMNRRNGGGGDNRSWTFSDSSEIRDLGRVPIMECPGALGKIGSDTEEKPV